MNGNHCHTYEVWDTMGRLAYVGIADDFERRWAQHVRQSWWVGEIEVERVDVTEWSSRRFARLFEAAAINEQSPVYNTATESGAYREYLIWSTHDSVIGPGKVSFRRFAGHELEAAFA